MRNRRLGNRLEERKGDKEIKSKVLLIKYYGSTIKLPTQSGTTSWIIYRRQLDTVANANGWDNMDKLILLILKFFIISTLLLTGNIN